MDAKMLALAFAGVVRERRKAAGYSQEGFADRIDVHRTYMGGIERGKHVVTIYTLWRIAEGLGVHASDLLRDVEINLKMQD